MAVIGGCTLFQAGTAPAPAQAPPSTAAAAPSGESKQPSGGGDEAAAQQEEEEDLPPPPIEDQGALDQALEKIRTDTG